MPSGITGSIASGELTASLRAMAQAAGIPSYDELDFLEIPNCFNGRWQAGAPTTDFFQASFLCVQDGYMGDGAGSKPVSFTGATWTGTGAGRLIQKVGAFAGWDWYDGAFFTVSAGTGFTPAERYLVEAKNSDNEIVLANAVSIDGGVPLPAGANADTAGDLSIKAWANLWVPVPAPVGPSASNPEQTFPAAQGVPSQSHFWNYPIACLPPGALTNGAVFGGLLTCRVKVTGVANRLSAVSPDVVFYLGIDPMGSALIQDNRRNSGAVGKVRATRLGWNPGSHSTESTPYTAATLSDLGGTMLVTLPLHSLNSGDKVYLTSVPIDADGNTGNIDDIVEGQVYYACLDDIDAGIVDPANSFTLSTVPPTDKYIPVTYSISGTPGEVCVSRAAFGSMRQMVWPFRFTASEETANDDFQYATLWFLAQADGTTAGNELGVIFRAGLVVHRTAEIATWAAGTFQNAIDMGTPDLAASAVIPRTTPGNTMNTAGSGTESIVAAPLCRIKTKGYTDGGAVDHHFYLSTRMDWGGNWDVVEIDQKLHNEAYYNGNTIVVDAGAYNAANRTIQQAGKFTTYAFVNYDRIRLTGGTGIVPGYYELEAKEANNRVKLKADARLPLSDNANTTADIDEYPLTCVLGEESGAAQVHQPATHTAVFRQDGTYLGHVYWHENVRQQLWIYRALDGEYVIPGETLTLKTYRREKEGGSGAWGFHDSTPIRTYTVVAGRVDRGPQANPLYLRVAVSGPPNDDCILEVRAGACALARHRSR